MQRLYSEKPDEKVVMNGEYVASWKKSLQPISIHDIYVQRLRKITKYIGEENR